MVKNRPVVVSLPLDLREQIFLPSHTDRFFFSIPAPVCTDIRCIQLYILLTNFNTLNDIIIYPVKCIIFYYNNQT